MLISAGIIRSPIVAVPGTIPSHVQPPGEAAGRSIVAVSPRESDGPGSTGSVSSMFGVASSELKPAPRSASGSGNMFSGLFSSGSESSQSPGVFDRAARLVGLGGSETPVEAPVPKAKPAPKTQTASAGAIRPKGQPVQQAKAKDTGAAKPEVRQEASALPPNDPGLISGAQPTVPSGGFETRFGAWQR